MIVCRCCIGLVDCGRHAAKENIGKSSLTSSYDCYSINALHSASMTSNARESQGGAELIGISVERLHDTAIPNIAPGSCFQSWSQTIRMILIPGSLWPCSSAARAGTHYLVSCPLTQIVPSTERGQLRHYAIISDDRIVNTMSTTGVARNGNDGNAIPRTPHAPRYF